MTAMVLLKPFHETFLEEMRRAVNHKDHDNVVQALCHQASKTDIPRMRIAPVIRDLQELETLAPSRVTKKRIGSLIQHLRHRQKRYLVAN